MKYILEKDKKKRLLAKRFEAKRKILKSLKTNEFLPLTIRAEAGLRLEDLGGTKSIIKNHCIVSSRARGILSKFKVSRMVFKRLASFGYIPGIKKSSW